jgi:hypothetical protein
LRLFGKSTSIINQVCFHAGHPPMARPNDAADSESLNRSYPHIIEAAVNPLT